ncbi:hypothetical protein ACWV1L_11810, partial [Listeria monocytogenes]
FFETNAPRNISVLDGDAGMYDWDGIVIIDNNAYLKIDTHYYIN